MAFEFHNNYKIYLHKVDLYSSCAIIKRPELKMMKLIAEAKFFVSVWDPQVYDDLV